MASGINQNIEILGRVLHVQTELGSGEAPSIRTTVYDGGRIVASREVALGPGDRSDSEILELIRNQHALIVDNLISRSAALVQEKRDASPPRPTRPSGSLTAAARASRSSHPLPAGSTPSLRRSLRTRRLVGSFSRRFAAGIGSEVSGPVILEEAGEAIDSIMASPAFRGLRLDEQVRFFDLKERIDLCRTGGIGDSDQTALLADISTFAAHLCAINDRRELTDFDHRLLLWALGAIGSNGVTSAIRGHLEPLRGRDSDLDRLLDDPEAADEDRFLELLMAMLDRTLPGE